MHAQKSGRGAHGNELSGVETGGNDDKQRHERASTTVDAARNQSDTGGGHEPEERAASGARHPRSASQHHSQHRRAADRRTATSKSSPPKVRRAGKRTRQFRLGEGITGRVVQSSKPIVVPRVSREPMFLRRTSERPELAREEISYVCVPILLNRKAVGALGADFRFKAERDFDRTVKFLGVVASLMAQSIRIQRVIDAERERLREENTHLKSELRERYDFSNILGHQRPDAAGVRAGVAGGAHRHDGAHPRRVGHRQGADRAGHSLQLAAREAAVHQGELRGAAREPHRVGAVRLRKGRLYGRARDEEGAVRAGRRGHAVSR